jgi:hypothetical protein
MRGILQAAYRTAIRTLPPKLATDLMYFRIYGRLPNLADPKDFNEKIQSRKFYERHPLMPVCADKVRVKDYVARLIGREHVIPTLWTGTSFDPEAARSWPIPFVIKANNGSGENYFVRSETERDLAKMEALCNSWMARPYQPYTCEWAYDAIEPRLLVEPFIAESDALPLDYKVYVFDGVGHYIQVDLDREIGHKRCFYDRDWRKQEFTLQYPFYQGQVARPQYLELILHLAEVLGAEFSFVRCDFYEIAGRVYFGEMTFYPEAGFATFDPPKWDRVLGDLWTLEVDAADKR